MQCTRPVTISGPTDLPMKVPCGWCVMCKVAKQREWSIRLMDELAYWKEAVFLTATYRNEDLPPLADLNKRSLELYLKRLRKIYSEYGKTIRYFAVGEYGDPKNVAATDDNYERWVARGFARPHYHLILFGVSLSDHDLVLSCPGKPEHGWKVLGGPVLDAWGYGYCYLGTVTLGSIKYVLDYMQKEYKGESFVNSKYLGLQQPFRSMSRGLGKDFVEENKEELRKKMSRTFKGVDLGLPKYYLNKLDEDGYLRKELAKVNRLNLVAKIEEYGIEEEEIKEYVDKSKVANEKNVMARKDMFGKRSM